MRAPSPFVSTQWLETHLHDPDLRIVDASWYLPDAGREPAAEFKDTHIPGAVYFDLDDIAQKDTDLPHMVAPREAFENRVGALGISDRSTIIVYDSAGLLSAARVWWNFRIMGAENCFVLAGGLPHWMAETRPLANGPVNPATTKFEASFDTNAVVTLAEMKQVVDQKKTSGIQIVDLRPASRFTGQQAEPRKGLRAGKMPGTLNLPFSELIKDGRMLEKVALSERFNTVGIDPLRPIISTCGSGVTAPILNLALAEMGTNSMRVYDGSWAEWGAREDCPVITGKRGANGSL